MKQTERSRTRSTKPTGRSSHGKTKRKKPKVYKPRKLDHVDQTILELVIQRPGIKLRQIAEAIGYGDITTLSERMQNPTFKLAVEQHHKRTLERIEGTQLEALDLLRKKQFKAVTRLAQLVDSLDPAIAVKAAKELIRGLPEIANSIVEPDDDDTNTDFTEDEKRDMVEYQAEIAKRPPADKGGAA